MAYPKKLNAANVENKQRAISAHAGFVSFVVGKVEKVGIEEVLKSSKIRPSEDGKKKGVDWYWLKQAYQDVLEFAKDVQIREIPQMLQGDADAPLRVQVILPENAGMKAAVSNGNGNGHSLEGSSGKTIVLPHDKRL